MGEWSNERSWAESQFATDARLGIALPRFTLPWDRMTAEQRAAVLAQWESVRGRIPDRIARLEAQIRLLQISLSEEDDFEQACRLLADIAEFASRINDLNIWYRTEQDFEEGTRPHA